MDQLGLLTLARYAEVKETIITNVFIADESFITEHNLEAIECPLDFGVGDKYENNTFIKLYNIVTEETQEDPA